MPRFLIVALLACLTACFGPTDITTVHGNWALRSSNGQALPAIESSTAESDKKELLSGSLLMNNDGSFVLSIETRHFDLSDGRADYTETTTRPGRWNQVAVTGYTLGADASATLLTPGQLVVNLASSAPVLIFTRQ